jgi:C1A family cysteine protease
MKAAAIATLATMSAAHNIETLYAKYIAQYNKNYLTEEEYSFRQAIFAKNHFLISEHNMGNSHTLAHNKFSDWTAAELKAINGYLPELYPTNLQAVRPANYSTPDTVDWRSSLKSMKVTKDQGQCGSCWAFSTVGSIESRSEIAGKGYVSLSEQQLVDCVQLSFGCQGGNFFAAFDYSQTTGNEAEKDYSYVANNQNCMDNKYPVVNHHTSGFTVVPQNSPASLKAEIVNGPVSVAIEADEPVFQFYKDGVIKPADCGK